MKNFLFFIFKILFLIIIIAFLFETIYTYIYIEKTNFSKFHFIKNQQNKKFDYIFYGSSRVVNHIDPKILDSCLHRNTINFGVIDSKPRDILTLLQLSKFYNIKSDSIFIQTDYYYNSIGKSSFLYVEMLPYINQNSIINSYYLYENDYVFLAHFPFYKYAKYSPKLGIRELFASIFRKNKFEKTKGFVSVDGTGHTWQRTLPNSINKNNVFNIKTSIFLNENKVKYMFFTAPFRSDTKNMNFVSQLKQNYSDFWDFSTAVKDPKMFKNGYHLNHHGATDFSIVLSNKIKTN